VHNIYNILITILIVLTLTGCLANAERDKQRRAENLENMIACPSERPLSCTKETAPVCGVLRDGSTWDYDSACLACTRRVVIGFIPGPCRY